MSKQLLRSGTSIGAMVREAEHAESAADFYPKAGYCTKRGKRNSILARAIVPIRFFGSQTIRISLE